MPAQCRNVKGRREQGRGGLARARGGAAKRRTEAPVNGGRNYDGPKVAKFLVG